MKMLAPKASVLTLVVLYVLTKLIVNNVSYPDEDRRKFKIAISLFYIRSTVSIPVIIINDFRASQQSSRKQNSC